MCFLSFGQTFDRIAAVHCFKRETMDFVVALLVLTLSLIEIQAKNLDPGPQVLNNTTKLLPQSSQKRYATKEIILYLTPSQIKALQEGQGLLNPQHIPHSESEKHAHALAHAQAQELNAHHEEHLHQHLAQPHPLQAAPVTEPHSDPFVPIIPPPEYRHSDNYAYINFHPPNHPHILKPVPFFPEPQEQVGLHGHKGLPTLIPHGSHHDDSHNRDHLKEQWYRLLDQNRAHLQALAALSHHYKSNEHKKDLLQYAPKYSDHKYALDVEHLISQKHQLQFEKQHALAQAEAIANSPPIVVHKEINIKHSPVHLIKQVKVPVPTPVLIPVPEPFEVKVPQPYPVPFEIIKPVPVPIVKTQKIEVERQVPIEIEKHIPLHVPKHLFHPYFSDRAIPLSIDDHKTVSLPGHSHVWNH